MEKLATFIHRFRQRAEERHNANLQLSPKRGISSFWSEHWYLLFSMLIPVVLVYLIYLAKGQHPFGNGSVLVLDLNGQYVWFFEALRNFVRGDADLLYSFSRALGGEFLGIYAYYLASPLSFLLCLFPKERMLEGLLVLFLVKTALCGGTFGYYMHRTMKRRNPYAVIIFSVLYAMSSYALVQQHNTMWIDAVMWLPLITLGLEELIKHGKFKLYTVSLAVTLFSNYYIGYMVCIYCFLYFYLYYIAHNEELRNNPLGEKNHFAKSLARTGFYSIIAVGIAAVIILSAYYSLNFGKTTFSDPSWEWKTNFDILDLLYKFLPGSYDTVRPEGYPFVYCGLLTLLFLPAYFLSNKYPMRQKIVSGVFILILVASFTFNVTDLIWHGFQAPNWLNHRYSFMLCFYLCVLACRAFADFETVSLKSVLGTAGFIALLCVILQKYTDEAYVDPDDLTCIWFTILALFVYLSILAVLRKTTNVQIVSVVLISVISIEAFLNGLWNLNALDEDVIFSSYSSYNGFLESTSPIVEQVKEADDGFYRMEKNFSRKTNGNMALAVRGLSGSTSTLNKETVRFLNKMGYSSTSHWSKYYGGSPVNDSLLGVKYVISNQKIYADYYEAKFHDGLNNCSAYYNPYALSIAYGVDEDLLKFPLGFVTAPEESDDEDGAISKAVDAFKSTLNEWLDIDETVNTAEYRDLYDSPFERLNAIVTAMLGEDKTVELFVPIEILQEEKVNLTQNYVGEHAYGKKDAEKDASITFTVEMPESAELFFYMPSKYPREVKLALIEGDSKKEMGSFFGNDTNSIISLGKQEYLDFLSLELTLTQDRLYAMIAEDYFYYLDEDVFVDVMARLGKDQLQINEYTERSFDGTFTASRDNELVLTTIPYDKGWKVTVDGEEVETVKALGALVAFRVGGKAGDVHEIQLVYSPNTFWIGLTVSLIALGLLLLLILLEKPMKRLPVLRAVVSVPPTEPSREDEEAALTLPEDALCEETPRKNEDVKESEEMNDRKDDES